MKKNTNTKQNASKGKRTEQRETFAFYIGIDLGDKNSDVCVLNSAGEVHKEFRIRMNAAAIDAYFAGIGWSRVAIEVGGQSQGAAEVIEKYGHEVHVANTRKVAYIHETDDKDDPGDAYQLAELDPFNPHLFHPHLPAPH